MSRFSYSLCFLACLTACLPLQAQSLDGFDREQFPPGSIVTIHLLDGRSPTGAISELTDENRLWLSTVTERVTLESGFLWTQIEEVVFGPPIEVAPLEIDDAVMLLDPIPSPAWGLPPVRTLRISGTMMNWDEDAQFDGLEVMIAPLDGHRQLVPVSGQISFELLSELDPLTSSAGRSLPRRVQTLERWTIRLAGEDFGPEGALVDLPFRDFEPECDIEQAPVGRLIGRLSVPAQGAFEAYSDLIVRPATPLTAE